MPEAAFCKIFPPIGIARVGDSRDPDGWFIGPEADGIPDRASSDFSFHASTGHIKRQAARFRIVAFDADGHPTKELTAADAEITWTVSLANKKAAWFEFRGTDYALKAHRGVESPLPPRNLGIGA